MKNLAIILLVVVVGVLSLLVYRQRRQIQVLSAERDSAPKGASLELQAKCAKQAQEYLSQFESRDVVETRNHYNIGLNRCFVETRTVKFEFGNHTETRVLNDAFEGKEYGLYMFVGRPKKPDYSVEPADCKVTSISGEEVLCHSSDEFDTLVKQFME
jgi:hypothetical protein